MSTPLVQMLADNKTPELVILVLKQFNDLA
jgi:hypothetical protein